MQNEVQKKGVAKKNTFHTSFFFATEWLINYGQSGADRNFKIIFEVCLDSKMSKGRRPICILPTGLKFSGSLVKHLNCKSSKFQAAGFNRSEVMANMAQGIISN